MTGVDNSCRHYYNVSSCADMYNKHHWGGFKPSMQPISFWER